MGAGTYPVEYERETLHAKPLRESFAQARIDRAVRYIRSQIEPYQMPSTLDLWGQVAHRVFWSEGPGYVLWDNWLTRPADTLKSFAAGAGGASLALTGAGLVAPAAGSSPSVALITTSSSSGAALSGAGSAGGALSIAAQAGGEAFEERPCFASVIVQGSFAAMGAGAASRGYDGLSAFYAGAGFATSPVVGCSP